MKNTSFFSVLGTPIAMLVSVLLAAQTGCSDDSQALPGGAVPGDRSATQPVDRTTPQDDDSGSDLKQPLIRALDGALDDVSEDDLEELDSEMDKDKARNMLQEADDILTRIKEENRKGLERVNNPPRRVIPQQAPSEKDSDDEPEESREPGATSPQE